MHEHARANKPIVESTVAPRARAWDTRLTITFHDVANETTKPRVHHCCQPALWSPPLMLSEGNTTPS